MEQYISFLLQHWLLATGFVICLFLIISYEFSIRYGGAERVNTVQMVRLINHANGVVFDIRHADKFKAGHISGAISAPLADIYKLTKKLNQHKSNPVIIVDDMGMNSAQAAKQLIAAGFEKCHVLGGGMQSWTDAGLPSVTEKATKQSKQAKKVSKKSSKKQGE